MITTKNTSRLGTRALIAIVAASALFAACGGSDSGSSDSPVILVEGADNTNASDGSAAPADGSTPAATGSDEDAARAFTDCMRDNGVDDFPDPTVSADGSVDFGFGAGDGDGGAPAFIDDTDFQSAADECNTVLEGASFLPDEADQTELQDSLLEAAQCLRDQGLDVDDPDLTGGAPAAGGGTPGAGGGPFGDNFDPDDPEVAAAIEACQDVFGGLGAPGGN